MTRHAIFLVDIAVIRSEWTKNNETHKFNLVVVMVNLQSVVVVSCAGTETAGKIRLQIKLHSAVQMQCKLT